MNHKNPINTILSGFLLIASAHWLGIIIGALLSWPFGLIITHDPDIWSQIPGICFELITIYVVLRNARNFSFNSRKGLIVLAFIAVALYFISFFSHSMTMVPEYTCGNGWLSGEYYGLIEQRMEFQSTMSYIGVSARALALLILVLVFAKAESTQ